MDGHVGDELLVRLVDLEDETHLHGLWIRKVQLAQLVLDDRTLHRVPIRGLHVLMPDREEGVVVSLVPTLALFAHRVTSILTAWVD